MRAPALEISVTGLVQLEKQFVWKDACSGRKIAVDLLASSSGGVKASFLALPYCCTTSSAIIVIRLVPRIFSRRFSGLGTTFRLYSYINEEGHGSKARRPLLSLLNMQRINVTPLRLHPIPPITLILYEMAQVELLYVKTHSVQFKLSKTCVI